MISKWTILYDASEVTELLQKAGVAAMPVMNIEDQYADPHYQARGIFVDVEHPLVGAEILYGNPLRMSKSRADIHRPAPSLGEHNDYVLRDLLGLSEEEIDSLLEQNVIR